MSSKLKRNKYIIFELILIFILTLLYNLICANISGDEIWNYGFSYNISNCLIPYKDFNMVITPLYPILGAIFLIIFGKNLLTYHVFHALICTILFYYIKKFIPKNYYLVYLIFLLNAYPSYNVFCILLLYILMHNEDEFKNDYIIGIILGLVFLTKQNVGIFLCFPTIFIKDIKRIFKRIIGFLIPISILLVYLLMNNAFFEFIDYTFLGILSFAKGNLDINKTYLMIMIISIVYLIYQYIKTKDIKIIYLFSFQLLAFPMLDLYHLMIALFPTIGYIINKLKLNKNIIMAVFVTFLLSSFVLINFVYKENYEFINNTQEYKYRKLPTVLVDGIIDISNYLSTKEGEIYIICKNAYIYKLESNIKINKYDLLNHGNMGTGGQEQIIKEIKDNCSNKSCVFAVNLEELHAEENKAYAKDVIEYIIINYKQTDRIKNLAIFQNYE